MISSNNPTNSQKNQTVERRKQVRFKTNYRCWIEQDSVTLFGTVTNLSETGFFLRTLPLVGTENNIEIKMSLEKGVVSAIGSVRWMAQAQQPEFKRTFSPQGIGIEFTSLLSGQDLLGRFISRSSLIPETE